MEEKIQPQTCTKTNTKFAKDDGANLPTMILHIHTHTFIYNILYLNTFYMFHYLGT